MRGSGEGRRRLCGTFQKARPGTGTERDDVPLLTEARAGPAPHPPVPSCMASTGHPGSPGPVPAELGEPRPAGSKGPAPCPALAHSHLPQRPLQATACGPCTARGAPACLSPAGGPPRKAGQSVLLLAVALPLGPASPSLQRLYPRQLPCRRPTC